MKKTRIRIVRNPKPNPEYVKGVKRQRRIHYFKMKDLIETMRKIYKSKENKDFEQKYKS